MVGMLRLRLSFEERSSISAQHDRAWADLDATARCMGSFGAKGAPQDDKFRRWYTGFQYHSFTWRRRRALVITETELKLMAAAARMGLSRMPKNG